MSPRVILVTGSNTGIGFQLVRLLAQRGHTVYLAARREAAGKEAQQTLEKEGLHVKFVQLDVTAPKSIAAAVKALEQAEGKLDVLVNNAGVAAMDKPQNATNIDVSVVRTTVETNLFGLIQTTTAFLPLVRTSSQGVILNVTTDMASNTMMARPESFLHCVAYNTSKAAANSYTIALAHELREEGIKVNAVTPGYTSTQLNSFGEGGKSVEDGAKVLLPWALLDASGKTGLFIDEKGQEMPW